MKILIAHDGSAASRAALADLPCAGLPPVGEALVLTVADVYVGDDSEESGPLAHEVNAAARKAVAEGEGVAAQGAALVRQALPGWKVASAAMASSPSFAILKKSQEIGANLIVTGCRGLTGLSLLTLGSVSQKVLAEAQTSVRVARTPPDTAAPHRILLAVDGSPDSERAVKSILSRTWAPGTQLRVVAAVDDRMLSAAALRVKPLARWMKPEDTDPAAWVGRLVEDVCRQMHEKGFVVSSQVERGDPKELLLESATRMKAHGLFLGARGLTPWERFFMGSVSTALAARAPCSVEVVRAPRRETPL